MKNCNRPRPLASQPRALTILPVISRLLATLFCLGLMTLASACRKTLTLTYDQPLEAEIQGDTVRAFALPVSTGEYIHIVVEQKGIDVKVKLSAPDETKPGEVDNAHGTLGREQIFRIAETSGDYRLEISPREPRAAAGRYEIKWEKPRSPTEPDRQRAEAQKAFAQAKSEEDFRQSLAGWRAAGERTEELHTLSELGNVHFAAPDYPRALEVYQEMLERSRAVGDEQMQALALNALGRTYDELIEVTKARECYAQALSISQRIGDRAIEANALNNLGALSASVSEYQEALNYHLQALPLWQALGERKYEARALSNLGRAYRLVGDKARALHYQNEALKLAQETGDKFEQTQALNGRAFALFALGGKEEGKLALEDFKQALGLAREAKDQGLTAVTLNNLGAAYEALGQPRLALDYLREALPLRQGLKDRRGEAITRTRLGLVHDALGDRAAAARELGAALKLSRLVADHYQEATVLAAQARVARHRGRLDEARKLIEQTLKIVETLRVRIANPDLRTSFYAAQQRFYEFRTGLLMELHQRRPRAGHDKRAFLRNENTRVRSLRETLLEARVEITQGIDLGLLKKRNDLRHEASAVTAQQTRLLSKPDTAAQATAMTSKVATLNRQLNEVEAQIRKQSPRYAALFYPPSLGLADIRREVLDRDAALLEYSLGEEQSYLWLTSSTSFAAFPLPPRERIEKVARDAYEALTARAVTKRFETADQRSERITQADQDYLKHAADLSRMLLAPVAAQIRQKQRLLIVADGALQFLPFAALPIPPRAGAPASRLPQAMIDDFRPLLLEHEIVSLPSAATLATLRRELAGRQPAPKTVAVLADPVFDPGDERFPVAAKPARLQPAAAVSPDSALASLSDDESFGFSRAEFTSQQAEAIRALAPASESKIALGFDASLATAMGGELSQYRYVIFATHGRFVDAQPARSGLALSTFDRQGAPQAGFLDLGKIYNLDLPAELVVLSACQTALGDNVRGEGLVGTLRGFMSAGARRVVASLFSVSGEATAELLGDFYTEALRNHTPPAAALRVAQQRFWERHRHDRWQSPYYYAGFVLAGEPR